MSFHVNSVENCACCGTRLKKGERIHAIDPSKEWFRFIFEKELKLVVDHACFMRIYRGYQASSVKKEAINLLKKEDKAMQTDQINVVDSSTMTDLPTTPISHSATDFPLKRRANHSMSLDDAVPSQNNNMIELPFFKVPSSRSRCSVCLGYYAKTKSPSCSIDEFIRCETFVTHHIMIREGSTCCCKHVNKNQLTPDAINLIKTTKPDMNMIRQDELIKSLDELKTVYNGLKSMVHNANQRPTIDFNEYDRFTDQEYFILTGIKKNDFINLCSMIPSHSLRNTQLRSSYQAIGCLLVKLRLGLSNSVLSLLFSLPDVKAVSRVLDSARTSLMEHFVPRYLGFQHISRQDVINKHTRPLAARLFTKPGDNNAILILDGTYVYVQKSANNIVQRKTFSLHKGRPLIKPMMLVSTDGYIISAIGPYLANARNNDASITKHIMLNNREGIINWLEPNDVLIVDRGFRDSLPLLNNLGYKTYMPAFLKKADKQLSTADANQTRLVTKIRWVVESANGRIKTWRFFDRVVPNSLLPIVGDLFSIVCALTNAYRPLFVRDVSNDDKIADTMLSLLTESNKLKDYVDKLKNKSEKTLKWIHIDAHNAVQDFPILSLDELNDITLGCFQIKQAKRYTMEHLSTNGSFFVQLAKQKKNILKAQLQSRHRSGVLYNLYIQYSNNKINGWYCQCRSGSRVIGCCSHIAAVIWYLGYARYKPQQLQQRSNSYLETLDNASDYSDTSSDDSETEDSNILYSLV